jgi:hypothetical protein
MAILIPRALLAATFVFAVPAAAQQAPPAASETDIVVTGEREQAIRDFVGALTQVPSTSQIARFEEAICPAAYGLSGPARAMVVGRMRQVAAAAGLNLGGERCRPNVLLMITEDKQALIRALQQRNPSWFGDQLHNDAYGVAQQPGPTAAWHAEAIVNADGRALRMVGGFSVNRTTRQATRLEPAARPAFIAAAVVVERQALPGLSTTQLADYAMMRALARTDPSQLPALAPSILRVVEAPADSEVPLTLTSWDLGFLRGLYASRARGYATAQRGEIGQALDAELRRAETAGN